MASDVVKKIKEQVPIAEVVGEFVRLKKVGSNHSGLCPFHNERTPSFTVNERKQIFYCFGCQKGGDVLSFLQELQGISFKEALQNLAFRYNIQLPRELAGADSNRATRKNSEEIQEIYYRLNRFVAQFYHQRLFSSAGKKGYEYLKARGISEQTMKQAYLGYAPAEWGALSDFLKFKKAPLDKAEELGLIKPKTNLGSERAHYDVFRDRVIFPVTDLRGRIIGFGGRLLDGEGPKYLNSAESSIFKKGSMLFGLFYAQKNIRAEDNCVIVEGFMDCLTLHQAGIGYAVATLGTALTEKQVLLLKRMTENITLLFDGDSAGQEAQTRAMELFLDQNIVVKGIALPDEYDPDEFVREKGGEALQHLLKSGTYLLDQKILEAFKLAGGATESKAKAIDLILGWIGRLSSETAKTLRVQEVASLFQIKPELLTSRLVKTVKRVETIGSGFKNPIRVHSQQRQSPGPAISKLDAQVVEFFIQYPWFLNEISEKEGFLEGLESGTVRDFGERCLAAPQPKETSVSELVSDWAIEQPELKSTVTRALVLREQARDNSLDNALEAFALQALNEEERLALQKEFKDLETKVMRRGLEKRRDVLRTLIEKTGNSGYSAEFSNLMQDYNRLIKRLDETKGGLETI